MLTLPLATQRRDFIFFPLRCIQTVRLWRLIVTNTVKGHQMTQAKTIKFWTALAIAAFGFGAAHASTTLPTKDLLPTQDLMILNEQLVSQFGTDFVAEGLCYGNENSTLKTLSSATCVTLARLVERREVGRPATISISQLRRNRAVWTNISVRDRDILKEFDVLVLGTKQPLVAASTTQK
jgi:hypothetical protein